MVTNTTIKKKKKNPYMFFSPYHQDPILTEDTEEIN